MGTPEAGKLFLEALTGSGLEDIDLDHAPNFDTVALHTIRDIKATDGRVTCVLPVEARVQNRYNTLHGGCIATLVDVVGSAALVTQSERSGVSLHMSVEYLRPALSGDDVFIDAQVVKVGGLIATINVDLTSMNTGALIAQGKHIKFLSSKDKGIPRTPLVKTRSKL
ncbi:probable acyl-coenzyme A thioesterase 13 [Coccomyxa sp. Obi]|nr:probable acyl-coenzyme A thioesterase 13 [Coccomyxa sp. Obi]